MTPTDINLTEAAALLDNLRDLVAKGERDQWREPPRDPRERVGSRSGEISDPTGDLASNTERLALRRAMQLTEKDSAVLLKALQVMHFRMATACKPYEGR